MRHCAGLVLSVAGVMVLAPGASATTFCDDPSTAGIPECTRVTSPEQALNMAAAHPGFDTVVLGAATYDVGGGLAYSDGGDAGNGVRIESTTNCPDRYGCDTSTLRGGAPGSPLLRLDGAGGAEVSVQGVQIQAMSGAIGLALGPGARADGVKVWAYDAIGVRLDGAWDRPAVLSGSASGDIAVDVPGYGIVENSSLIGPVGVRGHTTGFVDIRGGGINAHTGLTAPFARLTGTAMTFADPDQPGSGSPVGVEAVCADAHSLDASIDIVNATIAARGGASATGVRAAARGGDGIWCDASIRMSSSIVHRADVSLDAHGEAGSGMDPRDGTAGIEASYSDFSAAATRATGPAVIETSSPGQNVDADPLFAAPGWLAYPLLWKSPLIDAGDPAPPEEWQRPYIDVVNGRRDIGEFEYGFRRPTAEPFLSLPRVATGTPVTVYAHAYDADPGDPLEYLWTLPDGSTSTEETFERTFSAPGRYTFHVKVTDPTERVAEDTVTARVLRQKISDMYVDPARFRPSPRRSYPRTTIRFVARAADTIDFRVHRALRRPGKRAIRWKRVPGGFDGLAFASPYVHGETVGFDGWLKKRLRPGLYRLTARGRGIGTPAYARFRVIR